MPGDSTGEPITTLLEMRGLLWQRLDRYRTLAWRLQPLASDSAEDHDRLLDAVMAGDVARTCDLVEAQIRYFGELMLRHTRPALQAG